MPTQTDLLNKIAVLSPRSRELAMAIATFGPISTRRIARTLGMVEGSVYQAIKSLRLALAGIADVEKTSEGYAIKLVERPATPPVPQVKEPAPEPEIDLDAPLPLGLAETQSIADETPLVLSGPKRLLFRLPWGGFVDIDSVVGVHAERGSVVIQLRHGFMRSAPKICEAIAAAASLHAAEVLTVEVPA
jgi:biotin operon repressor